MQQGMFDVPRGKYNWAFYQDSRNTPRVPNYNFIIPIPPWAEVPKGPWNPAYYQSWQRGPTPANVFPPIPSSMFTTLPPRGPIDVRYMVYYQGAQASPAPSTVAPPLHITRLPLLGVGENGP